MGIKRTLLSGGMLALGRLELALPASDKLLGWGFEFGNGSVLTSLLVQLMDKLQQSGLLRPLSLRPSIDKLGEDGEFRLCGHLMRVMGESNGFFRELRLELHQLFLADRFFHLCALLYYY